MAAEGEDDDVPSPRTLRAAAERLAQYTSEQPDTGPTTQGQGFADIYSEVRSARPRSATCLWKLNFVLLTFCVLPSHMARAYVPSAASLCPVHTLRILCRGLP